MTLRLIQVGLGSWGRSWASSVLAQASDVDVVAWVDPDPHARKLARELIGAPDDRFRACLPEALDAVRADAVLVTSGMTSHAQLALAALRAGKHVLVEKPFAPTLLEAAEVVAEASARALVLAVSQNYRFFPSMLALTDLVRARTLGPPGRVRIDFRKNHPGRGTSPLDDHILTQLSIHHFDLMRAVFGWEPLWISCHTWTPQWTETIAPASAAAVIEFDGGLVVNYSASRVSTGPVTPWEGEWRVECAGGEIAWARDGGPGLEQIEVRSPHGPPRLVPVKSSAHSDRAAVLAGFVAAVRDGLPPPSPGHDNIRSVALLDAAWRSAATGQTVTIPRESGLWSS